MKIFTRVFVFIAFILFSALCLPVSLFAQSAIPPLLLETIPADGAEWDGGPVTFVFDQPMSSDGAEHLTIRPSISANVTVEENQITFTPIIPDELEAGQRYGFTINTLATSTEGTRLTTPVNISLVGETPLAVTSTEPSPDVQGFNVTAPIVIVFNQPVVPLLGVDELSDLPTPLTIEPDISGTGEWLNTSIYTFQPDQPLAGSTEYQVTIGGFETTQGKSLGEPYQFRFTTEAPTVVSMDPIGAGQAFPPDTVIKLTFNQSMEPQSVESAFSLARSVNEGGETEEVSGSFGWDEARTSMVFTPTQPLGMRQVYIYNITTTAVSEVGSPLFEEAGAIFSTLPLPKVQSTMPTDGSQAVRPEQDVRIRFNVPMSRTSVLANIHVTPLLTTTQVFSSYNSYDKSVNLIWQKEANTTYTVTVDGATVDPYGNAIGDDVSTSFTTGDFQPWVRTSLENFTHFSAYTTTRVGILYRNLESLDVQLYRLPPDEFFRLSGDNAYDLWGKYSIPSPDLNRVWERSYTDLAERNETGQKVISLLDNDGNRLPPGMYLLEIALPNSVDEARRYEQKVILISSSHLTVKKGKEGDSLAWLTDLQTGEPIANRSVQFWVEGALKGEARTDEEGVAALEINFDDSEQYDSLLGLTGVPGNPTFSVASTAWNDGIGVWEFGLNSGYFSSDYVTHFYTERPIYRPGQKIYWKGIIRARDGNGYALPPTDLPVRIEIYDGQGNILTNETMMPNEHGTLHGEFELAEEAVTGFYNINISSEVGQSQLYGGTSFQVAAYRKPEFEISLTTEKPEYQEGDTIKATLEARYFSGGPLSGAQVTWRVLAEPYNFRWDDQPPRRYYSFRSYNPDEDDYDPFRSQNFGGVLQEGTGTIGPDGTFLIELDGDLSNSFSSQRWIIDATVQSSTNQFVSSSVEAVIHKSDFYIGISPQRYVVKKGEESTVDLVTLTPEQTFYPNAELEIIVQEFKWNSVYEKGADGAFYWRSEVERAPILTETIRADDEGAAAFTWTPTDGGSFQIVARGVDQPTSSAGFVYVSDFGSYVAWRRENHDRIELVADKEVYNVGDVAQVLIPSPFVGPVTALVTLERGGVLESQVITLESNSETLEVPITNDHIPNIFISILLVKGIDETNEFPAMRIGYAQLQVDTAEKELTLTVETSEPEVRPGDTVDYTVLVTDAFGEPVANTEVSLALVDKAIFALSDAEPTPLVNIYYSPRGLGVDTGVLLNINQDRLSQQLSEGTKGGGGGGNGGLEIRGDFRDVAFWAADLVTGEDGQLGFTVDLPDNLTSWRLVARTVSDETLVGEVEHDLIATKRLQMRTLLPRFFTAGDRVQIGAALLNSSDADLTDGRLTLSVSGATIAGENTSESILDELTLPASTENRYDWTINVDPTASSVNFLFAGEAGGLSDGVSIEIPVKRFVTKETVGTTGAVDGLTRVEAVRSPADAQGPSDLLIQVEPSLAAGMLDGLDYLEHYEYECNEQTVSRFLPNLFTVRALRLLEQVNPTLEESLERQLEIGVQRLVNRQNRDGGWGYWPGQESTPFVSAYVLWGLIHAQEMGQAVPEWTTNRAIAYLEGQFSAPSEVDNDWVLNQMAFVHLVLSEAGVGDPGRASALYDVRDRLQNYGKAYLAMALGEMASNDEGIYETGADPRVETLLDNLFGTAELTATSIFWSEPTVHYRTLNTNTRTTAIALAAFSRLASDDPMLPQVVRWLMDARKAGRWATTQENAWSLIALTDWMQASRELEADYNWRVSLDGEEVGAGTFDESNLAEKVQLETQVSNAISEQASLLQFERDNSSGQFYYTTYMRYYLDASKVDARERGIVVSRRMEMDGQPVESVQIGDVVTVTVTLVAPTDLHHVLVEAPLPAGMEPIDPTLATESENVDRPGQVHNRRGWWWYWWSPNYVDIRDDKVAFFATFIRSGTYEYRFQARATVPGAYQVRPVYAEQMYFPEVWGRGDGSLFEIRE
ncbi:MAG: Ig-like domain-containing protein [Chloroflexota bacterium]